MAVKLAALLLLFTTLNTTPPPFNDGVTAYENGDYAAAAAFFEQTAAAGEAGAALYYNLGSAYFQLGDMGRALLNYRRAQLDLPRDAALDLQIAIIRASRLNLPGEEADPLTLLALSSSALTLAELAGLVLLLWAGWHGLLLLRGLRPAWREALFLPLSGLTVLLAAGLLLLGARLYIENARPEAVVIADSAPVMSGPGPDYLNHFQLFAAAELRVLQEQNGWLRFVLPDGRQGWVEGSAVEYIHPTQ